MKPFILTLTIALLAWLAAPAHAGTTCTRIGDMVFCTDDGGRTTTCTRIGDMVFCN